MPRASKLLGVSVIILGLAAVRGNGCHDASGHLIGGLSHEEEEFCTAGAIGDEAPTIRLWAKQDPATRGPAPYPFPADRKYNTSGGPVEGKINVHLVPHTHDDTGWQITVDQYFANEVFYVIDNVVNELAKDPNRKFIYVETAFFARWWEQVPDERRALATKLVKGGQLEFINGGWCMHDEASPLWTAMVDQTTRGHQFLLKNFGVEAAPRGTWQIDPFGHSNTQAWLLGAEAGMESLFWGRMDWQDRNMRYNKQQGTDGFEWIWQGSRSLGNSAQVFAGNLFGTGGGGYASWFSFDGEGSEQVNDDPAREDYNVDQWIDKIVQNARNQANHTQSEHQLWALGSDFQYQNANHWYRNLDKLIHYLKVNNSDVNAFYSTPSLYVDQKKKWTGHYEVRTDDVMPLADNSHNYWSGYFTSRPALKRQVRIATNVLMAARQLEIYTETTAKEVQKVPSGGTVKHSPTVGDSWTDSFEGTIGVATHHDGMSGTERQDVTDDYAMRISNGQKEVEVGLSIAIGKLLNISGSGVHHCGCHQADDCLNISVCAATTGKASFTIAAWNPLGHSISDIARVPVNGASWTVTDSAGHAVATQVVPLDNRTLSLPLLYLNSFNMSAAAIAHAKQELSNKADHLLLISLDDLPPVGLATFHAKRAHGILDGAAPAAASAPAANQASSYSDTVVESDVYSLSFDATTHLLKSITNKLSGATTSLTMSWGWYNSSVGGCTEYPSDVPKSLQLPPCSGQRSGAYIFRPNSSTVFFPGPTGTPTLEVIKGPLVTEVRQSFSNWASHVIRLFDKKGYVEVEWTAGPIPIDTPWHPPVAHDKHGHPLPNEWGKEVILKYSSGIKTGDGTGKAPTWYTDSNGKELVQRVYNQRGPSYPMPYNISEPVAGNYYPVNAMMAVKDADHELTVLTDVSQAGASLQDGALEFMVHRRVMADDSRGVQEPLNETMCGCNDINAAPGKMGAHGHLGDGGCHCEGLTMRGRHLLIFDTVDKAHEARRTLSEQLNFPPLLSFTDSPLPATPPASALGEELPPNVKLVTLTSNYASINNGKLLLRLSHLYEAGEHPTLAQPATVDLSKVFSKGIGGKKLVRVEETTVTASKPLAPPHKWRTRPTNEAVAKALLESKREAPPFEERVPLSFPMVTLRPMEVRTFLATLA